MNNVHVLVVQRPISASPWLTIGFTKPTNQAWNNPSPRSLDNVGHPVTLIFYSSLLQVMKKEPHGRPADIYSVGCFMLELTVGVPSRDTLPQKVGSS